MTTLTIDGVTIEMNERTRDMVQRAADRAGHTLEDEMRSRIGGVTSQLEPGATIGFNVVD